MLITVSLAVDSARVVSDDHLEGEYILEAVECCDEAIATLLSVVKRLSANVDEKSDETCYRESQFGRIRKLLDKSNEQISKAKQLREQ
jgi:hypothetical protein